MEFRPPKEMSFVDNISEQQKEWHQQFNIFIIASGKNEETDERKINILLNLIGTQGIKIYNNLKKPKKSSDISNYISYYILCCQWFSEYCEPRKIITFQRYRFGSCIQKEGETFDEFVTELKTFTYLCGFKEEDNIICDRIVFGIRDAETKNKLLSLENLTLDKSEMLCRTREVTDKEIKEMTIDLANVHYIGREQNTSRNTWSKNKGDKSMYYNNNNKIAKKENKNNKFKKDNKMYNSTESYDCKKCGSNHKLCSCPWKRMQRMW